MFKSVLQIFYQIDSLAFGQMFDDVTGYNNVACQCRIGLWQCSGILV
jgi:hypothetical protein